MKRSLFLFFPFLFLWLVFDFVSGSLCYGGTIFRPKKHICTTRCPNIYHDTFVATPGQGHLVIRNCEPDSKHRVTSAVIEINGIRIFSPQGFQAQSLSS